MKNDYEIRGTYTAIFIRYEGETLETSIDTVDLSVASGIDGTWYGHLDLVSNQLYVVSSIPISETNRKQKTVRLHRLIMGNPKGKVVDHINNNTLDNKRSTNLRAISQAHNTQNRRYGSKRNKSGFQGVHWHKQRGKWVAQICVNGKNKHLGLFDDKIEAAKVASIERARVHPYSKDATKGLYDGSSVTGFKVESELSFVDYEKSI